MEPGPASISNFSPMDGGFRRSMRSRTRNRRARRGPCPCRGGGQHSPGRVKRWHAQPTPRTHAAAVTTAVSAIPTWNGAIGLRDNNSPVLSSDRSIKTRPDASVTIRLLNSTPTQRVSRTCAETDVLAADHQAAPCGEDRSLNDARSARLEPCNRYTLERAAPQHLHQGMPSIRHHPPTNFDSCSKG
jgi:hypothetical protein